jgi:hypothetical protein
MTGEQGVLMQQVWPTPDGFRLDASPHPDLGSDVTGKQM